MRAILPALVLALAAAGPAHGRAAAGGQEGRELARIEVTVTSAVGRSVFLDRGSDDGLVPGDRVRLLPHGRAALEAEVRSVARASARAELVLDEVVEPGTPGEVLVPAERLRALEEQRAAPAPPAVPEHPPWTAPPESWSSEVPLLAPPAAPAAAERELEMGGSTFLQLDGTLDREGDSSREAFARSGADVYWENPFGRGGRLDLDVELVHRSVSFDDQSEDESQTRLRLQRFSYLWGGTREAPRSWEIGRFLQRGFPEFGLLDGVELAQRFGIAHRVGLTAGYLPEHDLELSTGEDAQLAAYVRRDVVDGGGLGWGLGFQKTWHEGTADRDLLAATLDWWPGRTFTLHASALADWYTSDERVKPSGLELTELHVFGNWRASARGGASVNLDHVRVPDVMRNELPSAVDPALLDGEFQRGGVRVWRDVGDALRLSVRGDLWRNDGDSGEGGELRADWRDLLWERGRVSATVFANQGDLRDIAGVRLGLDRDTELGFWSVSWDAAQSSQEGFAGADEDILQQSVRAGWERSFGRSWSLSVHVEQLFGDAQDATTLGFYLQRRL